MTKRTWGLGWAIAVLAVGSFGCTTLPRAGHATTDEVDMLADVELTDAEQAQVASAAGAPVQVQRENSVDVAWQSNGKNIQLVKNPPVQPVTASMIRLDKRDALRLAKQSDQKPSDKLADAPPRGVAKSDTQSRD